VADNAHVSLTSLGLRAVDSLACPVGGTHHVLAAELRMIAAGEEGGAPRCQKCGAPVELKSVRAL
jgi:hypothetical protein